MSINRMLWAGVWAVICLAALGPSQGYCRDPLSLGGHLKYQNSTTWYGDDSLGAEVGPDLLNMHTIDLRLLADYKNKPFSYVAHAELLAYGGNAGNDRYDNFPSDFARLTSVLPNDDRRLLRLTSELQSENHFASVLRLDRGYVNYAAGAFAFRVGRQALSWGNGLVFQTLDIFNPFSPTEIDKDYKTGSDLLWGQWLFDSGTDLQALIVPRRDPGTDAILSQESSYAFKVRGRAKALSMDCELLGARHYDQWLLGAGFSRNLADAVLRSDVLVVAEDDWIKPLWLINIDRSWEVLGTNVYGFIEYFRNEYGTAPDTYSAPSVELVERLNRGELFTLGRDYIALGGFLEITPLQKVNINSIFNLHDESVVLQFRHEYDLAQDISLIFGGNFSLGSKGSEYGGIRLSGSEFYLSSGYSGYLRLSFFF